MGLKRYVRVAPYDPKTGALAERVMVGGCLFKGSQWYELDAKWAARLADLRQASGAPFFQIMDAHRYREVVQAELAAAYMRGGVSLAMYGALAPPAPSPPPKTGARQSAFDGMSADEASLAGATGVVTTDDLPGAEDKTDPDAEGEGESGEGESGEGEGEEVDVDAIRTHAEADELADRFGIDGVKDLRTVAEKKDKLAAELFTADDDEG